MAPAVPSWIRFRRHFAVLACTALLSGVVFADDPPPVDAWGDPLPSGARARLGTVRYRLKDGYGPASFTDDGRVLVREGDVIHIVNVDDGRITGAIPFDRHSIRNFTATPDGSRLALFGSRHVEALLGNIYSVTVWDVAEQSELAAFEWRESEGSEPRGMSLSANGTFLAVGEDEGRFRLLDAESGAQILTWNFETGIDAVALSSDGTRLAVATDAGVWFWDWFREQPPVPMSGFLDRPSAVCFSPDGRLLAAASDLRLGACLWDLSDRSLRHHPGLEEQAWHITDIAFTHDGSQLATLSRHARAVHLWDVQTGELSRTFETGSQFVSRMDISPDDQRLLVTGHEHALKLRDLGTGEPIGTGYVGHLSPPSALTFTPDGQALISADDSGLAIVWNYVTGAALRQLRHDDGRMIRGLAVSPDGELVATSSLDDTVRIWNRLSGEERFTLYGHGGSGGTRALLFTPDGARLLSWGDDLYLRAFVTRTGKAVIEHALRPEGMQLPEDQEGRLIDTGSPFLYFDAAMFTPDGDQFLLSYAGTIHVFDVATGKTVRTLPVRATWGGIGVSPDGRLLAGVERGPNIETPLGDGRVRSSVSRNQAIRIYEIDTGDLTREIALPPGYTRRVAFARDGSRIAASVRDEASSLHVYDLDSGDEVAAIPVEGLDAWSLQFSPDGRSLAVSCSDTSVLVWDVPAPDGN